MENMDDNDSGNFFSIFSYFYPPGLDEDALLAELGDFDENGGYT
jgi:hypothetical protein